MLKSQYKLESQNLTKAWPKENIQVDEWLHQYTLQSTALGGACWMQECISSPEGTSSTIAINQGNEFWLHLREAAVLETH